MILRALGAEPPLFAHLPLLHGPDGKKLEAPRRGVGAGAARRRLPARGGAQLRVAARLGLRRVDDLHDDRRADRALRLSRVSRNPAVFDEQKLRWMNGRYLRELPPEDLRARLEALSGREVPREAVAISQEKMQTLADFWPLAGFLVERPAGYDEKAWSKVMSTARRSACAAPGAPSRRLRSRSGPSRSRRRCAASSSGSS